MCQSEYQRELKKQVQLPTIWTIPDQMWQKIRPLLGVEKENRARRGAGPCLSAR
jgi:hypothetical protein